MHLFSYYSTFHVLLILLLTLLSYHTSYEATFEHTWLDLPGVAGADDHFGICDWRTSLAVCGVLRQVLWVSSLEVHLYIGLLCTDRKPLSGNVVSPEAMVLLHTAWKGKAAHKGNVFLLQVELVLYNHKTQQA